MPSACFHRRDRFRIPCIHRKILFPNISWPEKKNPVFSFLMSFSGIIAAITHLCLTRSVIFITSYLIHFRLPVKKNQLETELHEKQDLIVDTLNNAFTYEELHKALKEKTAQYFEDAKNSQPENSTIFMIKDYISRNYMNDTLSVKDISGHVYLSASYVCTFFKSETGQTLNQYLTEY